MSSRCDPDFIWWQFHCASEKVRRHRPIVVGYTWHRLAAKCANSYAMSRQGHYYAPIQLGVGVSGSYESAVHVTRCFMESMPNEFIIAKLDFTNAFNNLRRNAMPEAVCKTVPEIYKFCYLSYDQLTKLRYGSRTISSE